MSTGPRSCEGVRRGEAVEQGNRRGGLNASEGSSWSSNCVAVGSRRRDCSRVHDEDGVQELLANQRNRVY